MSRAKSSAKKSASTAARTKREPLTQTLPDYVRDDLAILSVGINPGRMSSQLGFAFAHPRNRFWAAFNAAQIVPEKLTPSVAAVEKLFDRYAIGFTDVVRRPTGMADELSAADWREGAPQLLEKLTRHQPGIAWFHGKLALGKFLQCSGLGHTPGDWGLQTFLIGRTRIYLTPSPSPANAAFDLGFLTEAYRGLKRLREALEGA